MGALNDLAARINKTSTEHGFWPVGGRNFGEMLMLATSELAEALEEHRDGKPNHYYKCRECGLTAEAEAVSAYEQAGKHFPELPDNWLGRMVAHMTRKLGGGPAPCRAEDWKPEGTAVELADCIIRCLDTLQSLDVDIDDIVLEKMKYNDSREHRHGRKY